MNRKVLLVGEGTHQHVLQGKFTEDDTILVLDAPCELRHETPTRQKAEHETLQVPQGKWCMGKQIEMNPFTREITQIWD